MNAVYCSLLAAAGFFPSNGEPSFGYLHAGAAYAPREGDLVFFDDRNPVWTALFYWAGTGPPLHMGIVTKLSTGAMGVLEAGPDDTVWVTLQDLSTRLKQFHDDYPGGRISIRRCKKELIPEASRALSRFAIIQDGKPYAILRLLQQGTFLRIRGPVRELLLGNTFLDRESWICSELAVAAGTSAGLFPASVKANVTYPRDLVDNSRYDLNGTWHDAVVWTPKSEPPRKQNDSGRSR